jgi:hypothetical protein
LGALHRLLVSVAWRSKFAKLAAPLFAHANMSNKSSRPEADPEVISARLICAQCIGESYLRAEVMKTGTQRACYYCGDRGKSWAMDALADRVHGAFEQHFEPTSTEPTAFESAMMSDSESKYDWSRKGDQTADAIAAAVKVEESIAEDIQLILADRHFDVEQARMGEESPYARDCHYEEKTPDDIEFQSEWSLFERDLKTTARFFSGSAHTILGRVFEDVDRHKTHVGRTVVVEVGLGKDIASLIRARVFQSEQRLRQAIMRPDLEVGPPPAERAVAGRMNAAGISVFYGARDVNTALSEVRPPVGSDVVTGRFDFLRVVRLLDVEALREVFVEGSIFDPDYLRRLERAKFLGSLSRRIAKAVMPEDEHSGYLITQVIADYLANIVKLDGILYRSVQVGEATANVVLFHHAARIETMAIPADAELDASLYLSTEDGYEVDYTVWEKVPERPRARKKLKRSLGPGLAVLLDGSPIDFLADIRTPTLKLDPSSVQVHHVAGVSFATQPHAVSRHRIELPKTDAKPDF